jgi:hypothetical protein
MLNLYYGRITIEHTYRPLRKLKSLRSNVRKHPRTESYTSTSRLPRFSIMFSLTPINLKFAEYSE